MSDVKQTGTRAEGANGKAHRALGTKFLAKDLAVAGLTSIGGLELTAETIDSTTLDSDGGYREFVAGFKDGGEVPIEGYLYDAESGVGQTTMLTLFESGDLEDFKIKFPESIDLSWDFKGIVVGFATGAQLEDLLSFSATVKVSGKPKLGKSS